MLAACAGSRVPLDDPGPLAARWRLPSEVVDGYTGSLVELDELWTQLARVPVTYVAERHDAPSDHAVQLAVLAALHRKTGSVGLGMEMFLRRQQPILNAFVAGELSESEFREQVEWDVTWGFDYSLYRPLLDYAKEHRIPIYGLNVDRQVSRALARGGLEDLPPELKAQVPTLDLSDDAHRAYVREAMGFSSQEGQEAHGGLSFENLYQAQVLWDEYMAESVEQALQGPLAPDHLVVLAGRGHVEFRFGIPERAARRGAEPYRTVLPLRGVPPELLRQLVEESAGDFLWLMEEDPSDLPFMSARPAWDLPRAR